MTETDPGTDLIVGNLNDRIRYARELSTAGDLIPAGLRDGRTPNPGKVLLAIETGGMLGIHPIAALMGIHVIDGKATVSPALMSGIVRRAGHKLRVAVGADQDGPTATAVLVRCDDPDYPFTSTWTMARAKAAGLATKSTWKAYPEAMLKARAIGDVCREGAEDVLLGVHYTPEELGASVNESGEVIEGTVVETLQAPPAPPEMSAEEFTQETAEKVMDCDTTGDLELLVRKTFPTAAGRYSWAAQFESPWQLAQAQQVRVDTAHGEWAGTLFDLFRMAKDALEAAEEGNADRPELDGPQSTHGDGEAANAAANADLWSGDDLTTVPVQSVTTLPDTDDREKRSDEGLSNLPAAGTAKAAAKAAAHAASERARSEREAEQADKA